MHGAARRGDHECHSSVDRAGGDRSRLSRRADRSFRFPRARSEAILAQHGASESHFETCLPDAVVFVHSTEEVVELVRMCVAANVPIVPFGAGTSIEGNATPIRGGVSVDLSEMNAILSINAEDFDCTVQAGVRREQLNEDLRDVGLFFPIDPGANATIGGMASTRASGTNAVRYGTMWEAI